MTRFEVVVRLYLLIDAPTPASAVDAAKLTIASTEPEQLAKQAELVALPYAGPEDKPSSDREYHP